MNVRARLFARPLFSCACAGTRLLRTWLIALSSPFALLHSAFEPNKLCATMFQQNTKRSPHCHFPNGKCKSRWKISFRWLFRHLHAINSIFRPPRKNKMRSVVFTYLFSMRKRKKPRILIRPKFYKMKQSLSLFFGGNDFQHHESVRHIRHTTWNVPTFICFFFSLFSISKIKTTTTTPAIDYNNRSHCVFCCFVSMAKLVANYTKAKLSSRIIFHLYYGRTKNRNRAAWWNRKLNAIFGWLHSGFWREGSESVLGRVAIKHQIRRHTHIWNYTFVVVKQQNRK